MSGKTWLCFHCDESFTDREAAREHFGESRFGVPLCQEPRVGDWHAECCIYDFGQIVDAGTLSALLEHYDEMDSGGRFWRAEDGERARKELQDEAWR